MTTSTKKSPKSTARSSRAVKTPAKAPKPAKVEAVSTSVLDGTTPAPVSADKAPQTAAAPSPSVIEAPQAVILGPVLRKKELIDNVVARSGRKKKDVKPVVEAMLEELGEALGENRELNLQPMGKLKVRRQKKLPNGRMLVAKIRQPVQNPSEKDG